MAIHKILFIPDKRLRVKTTPVTEFDETLRALVADMFETMYHAKGVGLAATQIGLGMRLAVIDCTKDKSLQLVLANPSYSIEGEMVEMTEGCLSVPGCYDTVSRANKVRLTAQDEYGKEYTLEAEGLLAEAIQHEIDHLDGVLYIDQLSALKKQRARKRVEKFKKFQKIDE